jgi:hypothetical protein
MKSKCCFDLHLFYKWALLLIEAAEDMAVIPATQEKEIRKIMVTG